MNRQESVEVYNDVMNKIREKSVETAMAQLGQGKALFSLMDVHAIANQAATLALMAYQELGLQLHQSGPVVTPPRQG